MDGWWYVIYAIWIPSSSVYVGFVMDKKALGWVLLRVFRLSPVSIIPPMLHIYLFIHFFATGATALSGPGPPHYRGFTITHFLDTPHSAGLLWTSDQPVAETYA